MTTNAKLNINNFCPSEAYIPTFEDSASETWFILSRQLLEAFGLTDGREVAASLNAPEYQSKMPAYARDQRDAWHFVSESGLYKLILQSDQTIFETFRVWATQIVQPIAAEDGLYVMGEEKFFMPPVRADLMRGLDRDHLCWLSEEVLPEIRRDGVYATLDHLLNMRPHLQTDDAWERVSAQFKAIKGNRSRRTQRLQ